MKYGELWEKNGHRWAVSATSGVWADLDDGTCRTSVRLDEAEANGWRRVSGCAMHHLPPVAYVRVWAYHQAPLALRDLSTNGGDEDWIAIVPSDMPCPSWMESDLFGYFHETFEILAGTVYIGSHA